MTVSNTVMIPRPAVEQSRARALLSIIIVSARVPNQLFTINSRSSIHQYLALTYVTVRAITNLIIKTVSKEGVGALFILISFLSRIRILYRPLIKGLNCK